MYLYVGYSTTAMQFVFVNKKAVPRFMKPLYTKIYLNYSHSERTILKINYTLQWQMQGRGPKGARGPLFLDPKKFLETTPRRPLAPPLITRSGSGTALT